MDDEDFEEGFTPVFSSQFPVRRNNARSTASSLNVYYEVHRFVAANCCGHNDGDKTSYSGTERIVLIMGFAAPHDAWYSMMYQLRGLHRKSGSGTMEVLLLDNIGIGKSSCPPDKKLYTTAAMAQDVLEVMDHLGWREPCHIVGFSMGGMIATKLAAAAPSRVRSLAAVSVTGGGLEVLPRTWKGIKYGIKALAARTIAERTNCDLRFHYSRRTLKTEIPHLGVRVRDVLFAEYCEEKKRNGPQSKEGQNGQTYAVWEHGVSKKDVRAVLSGGFPVWFLHGRHDILATPKFAERLAARFGAPLVFVDGGHFIPRECARECSALLLTLFAEAAYPKGPVPMSLKLHVGAGRPAEAAGASPPPAPKPAVTPTPPQPHTPSSEGDGSQDSKTPLQHTISSKSQRVAPLSVDTSSS